MKSVYTLGLVVVTGAILAACGGSEPPANDASKAVAPPAVKQAPKDEAPKDTTSAVKVDDKIIKLCGDIPNAFFAFDSSSVTTEAGSALKAVAKCFVSGPGKGKGMRIVGHADPRGETEYNFGLGQRRAGGISDYLVRQGVEQTRISASSKGELDASGTDEPSWAKDRKVEIFLAD